MADAVSPAAQPIADQLPGDRLEQVYRALMPGAIQLAYVLTRDASLAQDIAQDSFLRVMTKLPGLDDEHAAAAYLRTTVVRQVNNTWRSFMRRRRRHDLVAAGELTTYDAMTDRNSQLDIAAALAGLTVKHRTVLVLTYWHDLSDNDIQAITGWPLGTIRSSRARALLALKTQLGDRYELG